MHFSEVIGHTKQVDALRLGLASGRLHHAYLFVGPDGVGKKAVALALAQALYCDTGGDDSCGSCRPCLAVQRGSHADLQIIEPGDGKKEITIRQVRELEKRLTLRSFSGKMKIAIIDPAAAMNWPAQNALLKTLEEPPAGCLLVLIAVCAGGLLPTVRSRAFMVSFAALPRRVMAEFLITQRGQTREKAEFLAALTQGSLGAAERVEISGLIERRRSWLEKLSSLTPGNYRGALAAAEALATHREETLEFLEWAGIWYRDLLTFRVAGARDELVNLDMMAEIQQQAARADEAYLCTLLAKIPEAARRIDRNMNRRMVVEDLFLEAMEKR